MYKLIIIVLLCVFQNTCVNLQYCDGNNIRVYFRQLENPKADWNFTQVSGCISNESFPGQKIIHLFITGEAKPNIEKNFIGHMQHLQEIHIESSHVDIIEPGAFSNLPELKKININKNPLKNISKGVFDVLPSLEILYIHRNKISYIEEGAFANLPNLKEITLSDNNLSYLNKEWFTNTSNIEKFNVIENFVQKIPSGMFHGWKKLIGLYFNSNAISVIEGDLFRDNPKLISDVGLHHNHLESIDPKTFPDSVFISRLSISGNLLNYIPETFLRNIRVGDIAIYGNPFTCPCLEKINKIFLERRVAVDNPVRTHAGACKDGGVPFCGISLNNSQTCVDAVDKEMTKRFLLYLKNIRYDTVRDTNEQQCAMFDHLD